jgi:hypothetical protein
MPRKRTEIVKIQSLVQVTPAHQQLVRVNRMLLGFVLFLMAVVVIVGLIVIPRPDAATVSGSQVVKVAVGGMNPVISQEVNQLKGQMIGLVSGSIESKLRSLEESIKTGHVGTSLSTLADVKNDLKVLKDYSDTPKPAELAVSNQELAQEVSFLKKLIYLTIGSCALMFAATAGVWVKYRRLPYREIKRFLNLR